MSKKYKPRSLVSSQDCHDSPLAKYTRKEVAEHNKPADLWLVIKDKVYDFSNYAKIHPGGPEAFV